MQEAISVEKLVQSSWYAEVDYFHWNERLGSVNLVKESGALYTLGYTRQMGAERFRMELFGGNMRYDGYLEIQMPDGSWENEPLGSTTRYLGARGEYEYLLRASSWSDGAFILGLGNRVWVRDLRDATGAWGDYSYGYEETWWTIYPYLGLEAKRPLGNGLELFSSARVGATLITISKASIMDEPVWPKCGVEAQCEFGLRGPALSASAYCEVMTWSRSSVVDDYTQGGMLQPNSQMLTVGGKFGLAF
jgi:hypothetical protein